jgi:hypothetical protein
VSHRWVVALAIIAALPAVAFAQFTTFIAPPNPVKDSIKAAVVAEQRAVSDSITHAQITDMKTWVDSAAGIVPTPPADTVFPPQRRTTATSNGAIAPETASPLPFLLALGGGSMLLGVLLLRRPRPNPRRTDR